jgi:chaperonin GroEL (HSP60 family)
MQTRTPQNAIMSTVRSLPWFYKWSVPGMSPAEAKGNNGYNALTNVDEDMVKAGVIDPTKVTRTALANSASVATLLLTSEVGTIGDTPLRNPAS